MDALVEDEVDREILHRRVEQLLDRLGEPVDFVDEQDVAGLQVRENADQVAAFFEGGAG